MGKSLLMLFNPKVALLLQLLINSKIKDKEITNTYFFCHYFIVILHCTFQMLK